MTICDGYPKNEYRKSKRREEKLPGHIPGMTIGMTMVGLNTKRLLRVVTLGKCYRQVKEIRRMKENTVVLTFWDSC
ncbi:unnamed protein product [Toxocara canis]|uniref:Transposase n=1 Tax=Toxocara canis TaxID=6265 RepID=A0A183TZT2_TOXCA|nr:unnamed protein product [Toxocara canis]